MKMFLWDLVLSSFMWLFWRKINRTMIDLHGYQWWYRNMYLKSPTWKFTRAITRKLRGNKCRRKGAHGGALQVHHKKYSPFILWWGFLTPWNFEVLCSKHHKGEHEN